MQTASFQYTSDDAGVRNMYIGLAQGVVANGTRVNLDAGTFVLNYARLGDVYFMQVGVACGGQLDAKAGDFWPDWANKNANVFAVKWHGDPQTLTKSDFDALFGKQVGINLTAQQCADICTYLLM